jgi:NAD(P)-dependent dehydrogenase (short-subunit alcohol dehydrogenase family)
LSAVRSGEVRSRRKNGVFMNKIKRRQAEELPPCDGKTVIITGTGGLGLSAARALVKKGARVILAGRNPDKGAAAVAALQADAAVAGAKAPEPAFELLDLADLSSVRAFGERMRGTLQQTDVLINNAGVMAPPKRHETADGFEEQFGVNYLGHFALTAELLPLLKAARGRVVNVSSIAANPATINFSNPQFTKRYGPWRAYGQSKLAMLMFALELNRRSALYRFGITAAAAHPGLVATELWRGHDFTVRLMKGIFRIMPFVRQSSERGALPILYAAVKAEGGEYIGPDGAFGWHGLPVGAEIPLSAVIPSDRQRLWDISVQLTGAKWE